MGKFLPWLQERIRHWVKPATSTLISGILSDLARSRTELLVENALLRQQLIVLNRQDKRPQLTNPDRFWLVLLSHFTRFWRPSLHIIQPDTLLRWHRELFRFYWKRKSQGKPKISAETIGLIRKMAAENDLWGAERIRGELRCGQCRALVHARDVSFDRRPEPADELPLRRQRTPDVELLQRVCPSSVAADAARDG